MSAAPTPLPYFKQGAAFYYWLGQNGFRVRLRPDDQFSITPRDRVTPEIAAAVDRLRPDLIEIVRKLQPPGAQANVVPLRPNRVDPETGEVVERHPLTDYGNAERLAEQHGEDLHYCHDYKNWLVWDGTRWRVDNTAAVVWRAKLAVRNIYREAADALTDAERAALAKHATKSEGDARIRAMISLTESEPGIPVIPDDLDADPWLLNVRNGTIDLRTGTLQPHRREDLITRIVPVAYDPEASCPTFDAFLARILPSEPLRRFVQRAAGYSLTGNTREDVMLILWGNGNNGKSTLIEALIALTGSYGVHTQPETLMVKRNEGVRDDVADLHGARLVAAAEGNDGQRLAEGLIKQMTGGDRIKARHLYGRLFEFAPQFKIWFSTNHKPGIRGTDTGIWRRIRLIPFNVTIPEEERDEKLPEKLHAELPGILNWALAGCDNWLRNGLGYPEEIKQATAAYREEMDTLGAWLGECFAIGRHMTVRADALYASYKQWCDQAGERPVSQKKLGAHLKERGFDNDHDRGGSFWTGLGLLAVTDVTGRDPFSETPAREELLKEKSQNSRHDASHPSQAAFADDEEETTI